MSDRYVVTYLCGVAANGIYSVSYKIPSILTIFQTIWISKFTYKITNNKYGYEEYIKLKNVT